jgi:hypothetical protein
MDDAGTKPVEIEEREGAGEVEHSVNGLNGVKPSENQSALEPKLEEAVLEDDVSIDDERDTTTRTSTRLVKFQLFETKSVRPNHDTYVSVSTSSDLIKMKRTIVSSKSIGLLHKGNLASLKTM